MLFAIVLVLATVLAWLLGRRPAAAADHARRGLAAAMVFAGLAHLLGPAPFVQHLPEWLPARHALVYLSGVVEIGLGVALVAPAARRVLAGRALAAYLLAVWPANAYVAVAGVDVEGQPGGAYPWLRLPFQALFIAWALWATRARSAPAEAPGRAPAAVPAPVVGA
ncbi:MAG TPA: hypothetical protein VM263_08095 [Acidimicrobiales bacterium]|jgi:uncharacterized membrane protein|nr:hypothetical protein [Acidimicrobiales bacterium]